MTTNPQAQPSRGEGGGGATEMGRAAGGGAAHFRGRQVKVGPGEVLQPLGGEEGGGARAGRGCVVLVIVLQQLRVRGQGVRGQTLSRTSRSQQSQPTLLSTRAVL